MALTLPSSPTNGQQVTYENTKFTFSSAKNVWMRETLASRIESDIIPTTNTSLDTATISGSNLVFTKVDGTTSNVSLQSMASGSVSVYATESDLPSTGVQAGDHAFVTATNDLYIRTATQWRNIDAVNLTPTISASISSHSFGTIGESIDITYTTNEPEGTPVTVTTSNTGITNTSQVDISHHTGNNTVTVVAGASELTGGTLTIAVTDGTNIGTASVTLDVSYAPDWSTIVTTAILEGDASNQVQGETVALNKDGTILAVGVRNYKIGSSTYFGGAVRVYKKSSGTWTFKQLLLSNQQVPNVNFYYGKSLAIASDNDTIIVGNGSPSSSMRGIHIWTSSDNGESWSTQANVLGTDTASNDNFGKDDNIDISDDGNTMIVGSRFDDDTATDSGAVYVFTRSGTTWSQQQKLKASDAQQSDAFGLNCSISGDGNYIIVGAPYEDTGSGASSNGKVYIFNKSGSTWSQQASFQSGETDANDNFGSAVSIDEDGDTAVISASHDSARNAYVFVRSGTSWSQQQKLVHPSAASYENFGYGSSGHDISGDGNTIYIGSNGDDENGNNAGRGFVLTRTGTTWSIVGTNVTPLASTYTPGNLRGVEAGDHYGPRLAISRDGLTVAGGNGSHNNNAGTSTGAAYVMVPANLA